MITALAMILILLVSVTVHELAHYANARSVGVPVRAFSVGFGPILWRRMWRGTEWRLSAVPLGGYVDLPGLGPKVAEDGTLLPADEGMALATLPQKLWVLVGGVIANFILGTLLVTAVIMLEPGYRSVTSGLDVPVATVIGSVSGGSHAERLGLEDGDTVVSINGVSGLTPEAVVRIVRGESELVEPAGSLDIVIERAGTELERTIEWPPAEGEALLGITLGAMPLGDLAVPLGTALSESLSFSIRAVPEMVLGYVTGFGQLLIGRPSSDIGGPIAIVGAVGQAAQIGIAPLLMLAALINLSLAVFNLLPIPGLDGGRMLLAVITSVRGRPFKPGQEESIHFFGIMFVLLLVVLVTFGDIGRLFGG